MSDSTFPDHDYTPLRLCQQANAWKIAAIKCYGDAQSNSIVIAMIMISLEILLKSLCCLDFKNAYDKELKKLGHDYRNILPIALRQIDDESMLIKFKDFFNKYEGLIIPDKIDFCYYDQFAVRYGKGFGARNYYLIQEDPDYLELFSLTKKYIRSNWLPNREVWRKLD